MRRRPTASALALVLGALGVSTLRADTYSRPLAVPAPGLYAVPLDFETHGYGPGSLRLTDSSGHPVPLGLDEGGAPGWEDGRVTGVERTADGWLVLVELGPSAARHDRFRFEAVLTGLAEGVRLEAWRDGAWEELAAGSLFRLGEGEALEDLELSYEPSVARRLRLSWPESGGVPELRRVRVARVSDAPIAVSRPSLEDCTEVSARQWTCLWRLPEGSRRLEVELEGSGPVGFRLWTGEGGAWTEADSGVLPGAGDGGARRLVLERGLPSHGAIRLDLHGSHPTGARAERPVPRLVFAAKEAGELTLEYGEGVSPGPRRDPHRETGIPLAPGAERERPSAEAADRRPGAPVPDDRFAARWAVDVEGAPPPWASFEVPEGVYAVARPDLGDLRLVSDGRQIPFLLVSDPQPALVERLAALTPLATSERVSAVELGESGAPGWSEVLVQADAAPLDRRVRLVGSRGRGPDGEERRTSGAWTAWTCSLPAPLPCVLSLRPPSMPAGTRWRLEIEDGDDAPLPAVTVELYRRVDRLRFPVPVADPLFLLAGHPALQAPRFDLAHRADQVLAAPAATARARALQPPAPDADSRLGRALWLLALAAAVAALLWILARVLARPDRA